MGAFLGLLTESEEGFFYGFFECLGLSRFSFVPYTVDFTFVDELRFDDLCCSGISENEEQLWVLCEFFSRFSFNGGSVPFADKVRLDDLDCSGLSVIVVVVDDDDEDEVWVCEILSRFSFNEESPVPFPFVDELRFDDLPTSGLSVKRRRSKNGLIQRTSLNYCIDFKLVPKLQPF